MVKERNWFAEPIGLQPGILLRANSFRVQGSQLRYLQLLRAIPVGTICLNCLPWPDVAYYVACNTEQSDACCWYPNEFDGLCFPRDLYENRTVLY